MKNRNIIFIILGIIILLGILVYFTSQSGDVNLLSVVLDSVKPSSSIGVGGGR